MGLRHDHVGLVIGVMVYRQTDTQLEQDLVKVGVVTSQPHTPTTLFLALSMANTKLTIFESKS